MKPTKPITDRAFRYHNAASHGDVKPFERRMHARKRLAERRARQEATASVVVIHPKKAQS